MNKSCWEFRGEWLDGADASTHEGGCPECARWTHATRIQQRLLRGSARLAVPEELGERVGRELGADALHERMQRALGGLLRARAPDALVERVFDAAGAPRGLDGEDAPLRVLHELEARQAPRVLERLLAEELADPQRHTAERFSGNLERELAPAALEAGVARRLRRRQLLRLVLAPLATLAAASLVVWMAVRWDEPDRPARRFSIVRASSLEGLHPMARALAESLGASPGRRSQAR